MKRLIGPLVVAVITILFTTVLVINKPQPEVGEAAVNRIGVYVERATRTGARAEVTVYGDVRPRVQIDVISEVSGRVTRVSPRFIEGGSIGAGDALLTIEDRDYVLAVSEARARLAARRLELEQALADADVARKQLAGQKSPSPLALKKPQVARAESALKAAETALALALTNLERTRISLPFAGRVESQAADLGQYVNPGKVLGSVFGTDVAEVRLALTTNQLSALGIPIGFDGGEAGGLSTTLSASLGGAVYRWQGALTRLDAAIDPNTRTVYGTVQVQDPYGLAELTSGMPLAVGLYVDAEIEGRLVADGIQIAAEGLRAGDEIFVIDGEGLLDIRQVDVIHRSRHSALLASGVEAGEQVIVSAIRNPVRGMRLEAMDTEAVADSVGNEPDLDDNEA